jgi:hypothetical protein
MVRHKIGRVLATGVLAAAALPLLATTATASDAPGWLCMTRDATPVYARINYTGYMFTLSGGRGFRVHGFTGGDDIVPGVYGHGAQHPNRDGYARRHHIAC